VKPFKEEGKEGLEACAIGASATRRCITAIRDLARGERRQSGEGGDPVRASDD
jgi:hypothetical protein